MSTIEEMRPILKAVFTTKYPTLKERTDIIEAKALKMHPSGIYRDLIYDELLQDPTRTDDDIATDIAMRCASMTSLGLSIAHWERNAAAQTIEDIKLGTDHCALCHAYYYNNNCQGCPVNARTGQAYCVGSPYNAVHHAAERLEDNPTPETWEAYRRAAQAELDFLKSLRTP